MKQHPRPPPLHRSSRARPPRPTRPPSSPRLTRRTGRPKLASGRTGPRRTGAKVQQYEREKLPEAERAAAEAEERGRTAATQAFGQRLATSEIRTAAAEAGADLSGVFDYLDLSRFVAEDGEPDAKAIKAFVGGLPAREAPPAPAFDGGTRTPAPAPQGMTGLIRKAAGRA